MNIIILLSEEMQLQDSENKLTALLSGYEDETKHKNKIERYLGITSLNFLIKASRDSASTGWIVRLFQSLLVRGKKMRHKYCSYKMVHLVGSCDVLCKMRS